MMIRMSQTSGDAPVRVTEELPDPLRVAEVRDDGHRGDQHAGRRGEHAQPGERAQALDAEDLSSRGHDQPACREADEEREREDVEAPRDDVSHTGRDQPLGQLVDPCREPPEDEQAERGDEAAARPSETRRGVVQASRRAWPSHVPFTVDGQIEDARIRAEIGQELRGSCLVDELARPRSRGRSGRRRCARRSGRPRRRTAAPRRRSAPRRTCTSRRRRAVGRA